MIIWCVMQGAWGACAWCILYDMWSMITWCAMQGAYASWITYHILIDQRQHIISHISCTRHHAPHITHHISYIIYQRVLRLASLGVVSLRWSNFSSVGLTDLKLLSSFPESEDIWPTPLWSNVACGRRCKDIYLPSNLEDILPAIAGAHRALRPKKKKLQRQFLHCSGPLFLWLADCPQ